MAVASVRGQYTAVQGIHGSSWNSGMRSVKTNSLERARGNQRKHGFRWGLTLGALVLTFAGLLLVRDNVVHAGDKSVVYVVMSGDTLWTIANKVGHAQNDTAGEVLRIIQVNHLSGASIQPGERLVVPR